MGETNLLRAIPKVDELLRRPELSALEMPASALREAVRAELSALREAVLSGEKKELPDAGEICASIRARAEEAELPSLRGVINATGVVLHTNLGRACLSERAVRAVEDVARGYSTLEYDVAGGCRGSRHSHVEDLLCRLTGAESAMVVNNNAAAVLLILSEIGCGGEVVASRGELVEIGGSFRIPEIMMQCGCTLREVGATNKTHLRDYERAIGAETRALLKVHTSNFRIVGFSESVPLEDMVALGAKYSLPVIQDIGSGSLVDLEQFGIHDEPTVQKSIRAGVDVVSFSGDKLLGGPQAGVVIGKKEYIDRFKHHPLARAMRVDKMTLAALNATLHAYLDGAEAVREIPTLAMLSAGEEALREKALRLQQALAGAEVASQLVKTGDAVGGGSAPAQELPGWAVALDPGKHSVDELEERLRMRAKPIVARIHRGQYLLCVRTIDEKDFAGLAAAAAEALR